MYEKWSLLEQIVWWFRPVVDRYQGITADWANLSLAKTIVADKADLPP